MAWTSEPYHCSGNGSPLQELLQDRENDVAFSDDLGRPSSSSNSNSSSRNTNPATMMHDMIPAVPLSQEEEENDAPDALDTSFQDDPQWMLMLKRRVSLPNNEVGKRRRLCVPRPAASTWSSSPSKAEPRAFHRVEPTGERCDMEVEEEEEKVHTHHPQQHRTEQFPRPSHDNGLFLHQQILDQFAQGSKRLLRDDRHLLEDHPLEDVLRDDVGHQSDWLELVVHARHRAQAWDETQYRTERNVLQNWLVKDPETSMWNK